MIKRAIKEYAIITFGTILAAAAIYFFMLPSNLAIGSGTALAMVLSNFIPLPISVISLAINIILLILGFILIGPEFGAKTVYTAITLPVVLGVFEFVFPNFETLTADPLLDMVCYILVVGIVMAILFSSLTRFSPTLVTIFFPPIKIPNPIDNAHIKSIKISFVKTSFPVTIFE